MQLYYSSSKYVYFKHISFTNILLNQAKDKGESPINNKIYKNPSGESSNSSSISKDNPIEERSYISETSVSAPKKPLNVK